MIAMAPELQLLTLTEAGRILGVSKYTVQRFINNGTLEGVRIGGRWRVKMEAIERYIAKRTKPEEQ